MKNHHAPALVCVLVACSGCAGEPEPTGPPIEVVEPDYVVLRPVTTSPSAGAMTATVNDEVVYFTDLDRVIDMRHLDARTVTVEEAREGGAYGVFIGTTVEGGELLGAWTSANVGRRVGVFVEQSLVGAPTIAGPFADRIFRLCLAGPLS